MAVHTWFCVDGVDKTSKEPEIVSSFFRTRCVKAMASDCYESTWVRSSVAIA